MIIIINNDEMMRRKEGPMLRYKFVLTNVVYIYVNASLLVSK